MPTLTTQSISIPNPDKLGHTFDGYLARPAQMPAPGVLILHEAYGLNQNMRDIADRFANEGYVALAADLFSDGNKMVCMFRSFYGLLVSPLNNSTANHVRAAFRFLQGLDGVDAKRAGAIGFCMGGSYALQLACLDGSVRAISVVSGQNPRPEQAIQRACPVVGSYATGDFAEASGKRLDVLLDEFKIPHDIKIYAGAKHSMMNDGKEGYDPAVAAEVWQRTLGFFREHIS